MFQVKRDYILSAQLYAIAVGTGHTIMCVMCACPTVTPPDLTVTPLTVTCTPGRSYSNAPGW